MHSLPQDTCSASFHSIAKSYYFKIIIIFTLAHLYIRKIKKKLLIFITENILILLLVKCLSDTVLKIFRQDENCRHFSDIQI